MASSSNGNLVDEFEEAFQACIHALTKHEPSTGIAKDEINFEVDQTTQKFVDVARQMESFFIQKRFLLSALKPEFTLKEENSELRYEIGRKEDLIKRHFDKLEQWKGLLADQQLLIPYYNKSASQSGGGSAGGSSSSGSGIIGGLGSNVTGVGGIGVPGSSTSDLRNMNTGGTVGPNINASPQPGQIPLLPMGSSMQQMQAQQHMQQHPTQQQQQQQPQQHQQQQQQQQHLMQAQQMQQHMQQIQGQQMFMQQSGSISTRGGFNQGPNVLQGPLAYLEKTTSNIDLVGMGDGRR